MSRTYNARGGETFLDVSRRVYGNDQKETLLRQANPSLQEPFQPNAVVKTPQSLSRNLIDRSAQGGVSVWVNDTEIKEWTELILTEVYDGVGDLMMKLPYEPEGIHKGLFNPFEFQTIYVSTVVDGFADFIFTGTIFNIDPRLESDKRTMIIQAYSLPGVLFDCTVPSSMVDSLRFENQNLQQITDTLIEPFQLNAVIQGKQPSETVFPQHSINSDDRIGGFLSKLAREKQLIMGNNAFGDIVYRNDGDADSEPVAFFDESSSAIEKVKVHLQQREMYSDIASFRRLGDLSYILNQNSKPESRNIPEVTAFRPRNITSSFSAGGSDQTALDAAVGRMYANGISWSLQTPTWGVESGKPSWRVGDRVQLRAPSVFIPEPYILTVRKITFRINKDRQVARLDLMLPGVLATGKLEQPLPWV